MNSAAVRALIAAGMLWLCNTPGPTAASENGLSRSVSDARSPERRALSFLINEVPRWSRENHCFSCHNNGDAARALYTARQLGYPVPAVALRDTTAWLIAPARWKDNKGDPEFSDQQLADLQFASALRTARETGAIPPDHDTRRALRNAASLIRQHQSDDGSWQIDSSGAIGSPATYGRYLATVMAKRVLRSAGGATQRAALSRAENWLKSQRPVTVLAAAATVSALDRQPAGATLELQQHCLQVIRRGEDPIGGWGPYVTSRAEPFDTAVVLLALAGLKPNPELRSIIDRGRASLIQSQQEDGSWIETTRPANGDSYAQRLSTCGWATLSLLATVQYTPTR